MLRSVEGGLEAAAPALQVRYVIEARADCGLLCRVLGLFAQLDLPAPEMRVAVAGGIMRIEASLAPFGEQRSAIVARKMAGMFGVEAVLLEGIAV